MSIIVASCADLQSSFVLAHPLHFLTPAFLGIAGADFQALPKANIVTDQLYVKRCFLDHTRLGI